MVVPSVSAPDVDALAAHPRVQRACTVVRDTDAETLADMREVVRIPAPSLDERDRAAWLRQRMTAASLGATLDEAGNVVAVRAGQSPGAAPIVLAAHLDTVFPRRTDLTIHSANGRIAAPGIADNARGVAALLAIARALEQAGIATEHPLVFVGSVGEEGIGDLRGVKHLFRDGSPLRAAAAFIALDGTGASRIVHRAVGSRRLRVHVHGPGGHSWADRGVVNPIHALSEAVARMTRMAPARDANAGLAVGRIGGGTSVNAIPEQAWLELDLRAEGRADLEALEMRARATLHAAVEAANEARRSGTVPLALDVLVIGDRPSGATPAHAPLVRAARAATRRVGERPQLVASSTDANVPIALGVPAIALGAGGESGRTHTTEEWYTNDRGPAGIERALLTLLAVAGVR
jgi:acetylornithine deacetylase/succinyl-diaminopimelate desuccinylase-like protein